MSFAKQRFNGFLGQMAMSGAYVDYQRVRGGRELGQRLAKTLINGLTHQVLDTGPMQILNKRAHNELICDRM
jgi:hypothetical protein